MSDFTKKLGAKLKSFGRESWYFLTSMIFLRNFLGVLASLSLLLFLTFRWMHCYTNHGESLQVDNYVEMDVTYAIQQAKDRSFSVVVRDSLFIPGRPSNIVLSQDPAPMSRVKEKRTIYFTVTKFNADMKLMPDIRGNYNYDRYARLLKTRQINAIIKEEVFDNNQAPRTILYAYYNNKKITEEDIKTGVEIPMGDTVEFVITTRGSTTVEAPELVCMKFSEAKFLVENYKLRVGSVIEDQTITNRETAYVWKQIPSFAPDKKIRMGAFVDLYLTQYRPDDCN